MRVEAAGVPVRCAGVEFDRRESLRGGPRLRRRKERAPEPCSLHLGGDDQFPDIGARLSAEVDFARDAHKAKKFFLSTFGNEDPLLRTDLRD